MAKGDIVKKVVKDHTITCISCGNVQHCSKGSECDMSNTCSRCLTKEREE